VLAIFQKSIALRTPPRVFSAFTRDAIRGSVYVEARSLDDVRDLLRNLGGIISNSGTPFTELVSPDDRIPLLQMNDSEEMIAIHAKCWVRIKRAGVHRGCLALVKAVNAQASTAHVLAISRERHRKRKRALTRQDADLKLTLEELEFALADLSGTCVNATPAELEQFESTQDDFVSSALLAGVVTLTVGDRIKIISGPLFQSSGRIVDIQSDDTVIFCPDSHGAVDTSLQGLRANVNACEVVKDFRLGDFVEVRHGRHRGATGFITEMDSEVASIFRPAPENSEVRF